MTVFTPWSALGGGLLIGLSAVLLMYGNGRIAGISGIAGGLWYRPQGGRAWRLVFLAGLLLGTGIWVHAFGPAPTPRAQFPAPLLVLAGLLVGYGTALGSGCTSGHGVCGLARFSLRSLVAVIIFVAVAMLTTFTVRHLAQIA